MEENRINELNDEALAQVAGGGGSGGRKYGRRMFIGGYLISCDDDLLSFVFNVLARKEPGEIINILSTCTEYDLVHEYKKGGFSRLFKYLDRQLSACGSYF